MRYRKLAAWTVLCAVVALGGCGGDDGGADPKTEAPASPVQAWPVLMTFDVDVAAAKKHGRVPHERSAGEVLRDTAAIVRARLRAAEVGKHEVRVEGLRRLDVGFAALAPERRDEIVVLVTRSGTVEFLIEVLPDADYGKRLDPGDEPPARKGLWKRSAAEFGTFKQGEIRAWKGATAAGEPYKPTHAGYRLALERGKDGSDAAHFHVLEVPSVEETFDGRMLQEPAVSFDQMNRPVVVFEVKEDWQERFKAWTTKNIHLPLAILLDGAFHLAPTIRAALSSHVQISLGTGSRADLERDAEALATVLQAGALVVPPKLVSIEVR